MTGKERDAETGLDYFLARYYSSAQGRFTSPDEYKGGFLDAFSGQPVFQTGSLAYADVADPQTLNKYAYVRNNPLRYTDPNGHCFWDARVAEGYGFYIAGTAAVGAAAYLSTPQGQEATRSFIQGGLTLVNKGVDAISSLLPGTSTQPQQATGTPPSTSNAPPSLSDPTESRGFSQGVKADTDAKAGGRCEYCGTAVTPSQKSQPGVTPPPNERQTDHYDPRSQGGSNSADNAANSCRSCNRQKSDTRPQGTKWELPRMKPPKKLDEQ